MKEHEYDEGCHCGACFYRYYQRKHDSNRLKLKYKVDAQTKVDDTASGGQVMDDNFGRYDKLKEKLSGKISVRGPAEEPSITGTLNAMPLDEKEAFDEAIEHINNIIKEDIKAWNYRWLTSGEWGYDSADTFHKPPEPETPKGCEHTFTTYHGLTQTFDYCTKCDEKK